MKFSNRFTAAILAICLVFSLFTWGDMPLLIKADAAWDGVASSSFSSGDGTQSNPYIIRTTAQMGYFKQLLSEGLTFAGTYIKLMASLDMTGGNWTYTSTEFCGDFNGNGYTLTMDSQLFGRIGAEGHVHLLKIVCPTAIDSSMICESNAGVIEGCVASGTVSDSDYYAGGLVYSNSGIMMNVGFSGTVGGANMDIGGLVYRNTGTIQNAYCSAVLDAYSSGKYGGSSEDSIANVNSGTISDVYYDNSMLASSYGTGIAVSTMKTQSFVDTLNQNNPSLSTKWSVAASASVNNGFPIPVPDSKSDIICNLTGYEAENFICNSGTKFTITKTPSKSCDIYYTTDGTSPVSSSTRVRYTGSFTITNDTTVKMVARENSVYGRVSTQNIIVMAGNGTEASPYEITTKKQLYALGVSPDAHFVLKNDLTFTDSDYAVGGAFSAGWQSIEEFNGVFEGNGHAISNLKGSGGGFIISNNGTISGIRFINLQLSGSSNYFGTIAHENSGSVTKCYVNLNAISDGGKYVGGIVGSNSGTVSYCQIDGTFKVLGPNYRYCWLYVGGISGSGGAVNSCYSKLEMKVISDLTTEYVYYGGIAYSGSVTDCRNDGTVYFNVALDYDIYANTFSTSWAHTSYGNLSYTCASNYRVSAAYQSGSNGCYSTKTDDSKLLESTFSALDFEEKWMILENGPVPQGIMNADGTCYTKTGYRRPACANGYTTYVDQNGKSYTVTLPLNGNHLGGTATCTDQADCEICGISYGEVNPNNHTGTSSVKVENNSSYPFTYADGKYTSTNKSNSTTSTLTVRADKAVTVGVKVACSTEANYDKAIIAKNGTNLVTISGEQSTEQSVSLVAGDVLTIKYSKDVSASHGTDSITVELILPPDIATCTDSVVCSDCGVTVEKELGHNFLTGVNDTYYPFTYNSADGTYTSTNKGSYNDSTYTFTAQRDVEVTVNYILSGSSSDYLRIKKNGSSLYSYYGSASGTQTISLKQGNTLSIMYDKSSTSSTTGATNSITFSLVQTPVALCTEAVTCTVCNNIVKAAGAHTYVHHEAQAPTCTTSGWDAYDTCEDCAYTTFLRLSSLGHAYVSHEAKAPTCTEIGWNSYNTCQRCDYTSYREVAATGHAVGVTQQNDTNYPFTYSGGKYSSTNKAHNSTSSYTINAQGMADIVINYTVSSESNFDKLLIVKNGTTIYTYSGTQSGTVSVSLVAGDKLQIKYSKDGSNNVGSDCITFILTVNQGSATCTESVKCTTCNAVLEAATGHTLVEHEGQAPTCTETGWHSYVTCEKCNYSTYARLPAIGHTLEQHNAQAPDCINIGWNAYETCKNCDYTTYAEIAAIGHTIVNHEAKLPTCTEIGWNAYETCEKCNYSTYEEVSANGHSEINHEAKAPSCTEIGWKAYVTCEVCDYSTYRELPAGHRIYIHDAKSPTCTEVGWEAYENCINCDYSTYEEIAAVGHNIINCEAKQPTCNEVGWNAYEMCENCNYTTYTELPVTNHEWDEGVVVVQPTFMTVGLKRYTCNICKGTIDEILPVIQQEVDENAPQIVVDTSQAVAGGIVTVGINLKNNPGLVAATLQVDFDESALKLIAVKDKGLIGDATHKPELVSPYILRWANNTATENFVEDGVAVELVFEISKNVEGVAYPITLSYDYQNYGIIDWQMNRVQFAIVNGGVELVDVLLGDVNSDGSVDNRDSMILDRYLANWAEYTEEIVDLLAADVNCDGTVNNIDSMVLARYLAKWAEYESLPYRK